MLAQRILWGGGTLTSIAMGLLTWYAVEDRLAAWSFYFVFGVLFIASMAMFPWGQNANGSPQRLLHIAVRGQRNPVFTPSGKSHNPGTIMNTGNGPVTVNFYGAEVSQSDLKNVTVEASRSAVLPELRSASEAVSNTTAAQVIDERTDHLVQKVIDRFNETNPDLFTRWDDPRFLSALTSAQRSYAETGDEDLADLHAKLLTTLASLPVRSRREIITRQAIEVAHQLTSEHVNALAVTMFINHFRLAEDCDTADLIGRLDQLMRPYYHQIPSTSIDYSYMSSTGVCYTSQLGGFFPSPFEILHERYANSMYPAFTVDDLRGNILNKERVDPDEAQKLLLPIVDNLDAVVQNEDGTSSVRIESATFRVAPSEAARILVGARNVAAQNLTAIETELRDLVLQRSLSLEEFKALIAAERPDLAQFLHDVQRFGTLHYPLHPVGFILAQGEISVRSPGMAAVIDQLIDNGS